MAPSVIVAQAPWLSPVNLYNVHKIPAFLLNEARNFVIITS
jgi:hypothetical protein